MIQNSKSDRLMERESVENNGTSRKNLTCKGKFLICGMMLLAFWGFGNKAMGQFAGGSGTETDPYQISTPDHLVQLFYHLGNNNVHFKLLNNIDLTSYLATGGAGHNGGAGWSPIGNSGNIFKGTFNGAGFKITGLWIARSSTDYVGLFGNVGGTISNIGIELAAAGVSGNINVGGLAGYCEDAIISNCYVVGNVSGNSHIGGLMGCCTKTTISNSYTTIGKIIGNGNYSYVGGLIGYVNDNTQITNCYTASTLISGNSEVGGLLGYSYNSFITDCHTTCNVSSTNDRVGGLVGTCNSTTVNNCYTTGNVSGNDIVGGVAGIVNYGSELSNCYSIGDVVGNEDVGGLIGNANDIMYTISVKNCYATGDISGNTGVGGLVGYMFTTTSGNRDGKISISNCYAIGNVSGNYNDVGGLVGLASARYGTITITECYAIGNINGVNNVGGLIGIFSKGSLGGKCEITNSYATGKISGNNSVGGFIGSNGGTIKNSFFDYQTTGQIYGIGSGSGGNVAGKSTAEMKTKSTFTSAEWDFITIWNINEGVTYPFFINEPVLIVSPTYYNLDKNYGGTTIEVTSNVEWTVTIDANWLSSYTTSGSDNGSFYIYANQNTGTQRSTTVTVSGSGITAIINVTQDGTTDAISEVESDKLQIFPNPTNGQLIIENAELKIEKVEIYDIVGRMLMSIKTLEFPKTTIDISHLANGMYFLKVDNKVVKIIKN